jgi:hypothetical protein
MRNGKNRDCTTIDWRFTTKDARVTAASNLLSVMRSELNFSTQGERSDETPWSSFDGRWTGHYGAPVGWTVPSDGRKSRRQRFRCSLRLGSVGWLAHRHSGRGLPRIRSKRANSTGLIDLWPSMIGSSRINVVLMPRDSSLTRKGIRMASGQEACTLRSGLFPMKLPGHYSYWAPHR